MAVPNSDGAVVVNIHGAWFGDAAEFARVMAKAFVPRVPSVELRRLVYAVAEVAALERDYRAGHVAGETRGDWVARGGHVEAVRLRQLRAFWGSQGAMMCAEAIVAFAESDAARGAFLASCSVMASSIAMAKTYREACARVAELGAFVDAMEQAANG